MFSVFSTRRVHTLSEVAFPAKGLHQRRDEILDGLAASSHDKQEAEAPSSPVLDGHLQSRPLADSFLRALGETHAIYCKSIAGQDSLFLGEELAVHGCWIVRHDKHDNYAKDTGGHALDDLEEKSMLAIENLLAFRAHVIMILTNSHLQPAIPPAPSMNSVITPASNPETAPATATEVYSQAYRDASSYFLYHDER